ncbi:unnamed protein product [Rhizoctonia solani]|uniref:C6H2-type domain-containing protein n=1 Tax=Rhizoctonia solani TaxID=456999 RepID=A0A8H3CP05_9AGAM|nr:unnamed protein product [Rhizoctonia solani]
MSNEKSEVLCQNSSCENSNPPSRLECPTCNKLGITGSFFYAQECFKQALVGRGEPHEKSHKAIHTKTDVKTSGSSYNPFPNFNFTGPLRPVYPLSPRRIVPPDIPRPDYAEDGIPRSEVKALGSPPKILTVEQQESMRIVCRVTCSGGSRHCGFRDSSRHILTVEQQESMRIVCRLAREVLDIAASAIRPGITTDDLDAIVHEETIKRDAYPSPLNYRNFPKSLCTSVNEVICHGIPDQRKLEEGDIINLDVSVYYKGYHADLNVSTLSDQNWQF